MPERVQIFVDGANFHHLALKKLGLHEVDFEFEAFASYLADGRVLVPSGKRFYTGTVREIVGNARSVDAMSRQTAFLGTLTRAQWQVMTSKLKTRTEVIRIDDRVAGWRDLHQKGVHEIAYEKTMEKGIDVKIAVDMLVGAMDDRFDTAILVSSDTDLVPAVDVVRNKLRKRVEYVGFSIPNTVDPTRSVRPVNALIAKSDAQRVLGASDLQKFRRQQLSL